MNGEACLRQCESVWEMVNRFYSVLGQEVDPASRRSPFRLQFCKGCDLERHMRVYVYTHKVYIYTHKNT